MARLRTNLLYVYGANAINGLLGIALVPLGLLILGRVGYGLFSIYAIVFAYVALLESGLTKNLVRSIAAENVLDRRIRLLRTALGLYALLSLLILLILPLALVLIPEFVFGLPADLVATGRWIVLISAIEYIIAIPSSTMLWYANADEKFQRISRFNVVSGVYRYALIYLGIVIFRSPEAAVGLAAFRRVIDFFVVRKIAGPLPSGAWRPAFEKRELWPMISKSSSFTVAQICVSTVYTVPAVIVSRFWGVAELGAYRAIYDLASRVWFFSGGVGVVVFPRLVRAFTGGDISSRERERVFASFNSSWGIYITVAVAANICGPLILSYLNLHDPGLLTLWGLVALGLCMSAHAQLGYELLQAAQRFLPLLAATMTSLVLMASVCIGGVNGNLSAIGYAWCMSQTVYTVLVDWYSLKTVNFSFGKRLEFAGTKLLSLVAAAYGVVAIWGTPFPSLGLLAFGVGLIIAVQLWSLPYYRIIVAD